MNNDSFYNNALNVDLPSAIQTMISRSCLIDFGIIKEVVSKGVVNVAVSVANSTEDIKYITCVLGTTASSACTVDIVPNEGDKVLVLYPRRYNSDMFSTEQEDIILEKNARGYNLFSGIALLCNQYKVDGHKNLITIENGKVDLKLAYSEDDEKNKVLMSINEDGELHYESNETVKIDINKDNEITIDNGKATIKIDKNGNLELNTSGKYTIKNNTASLYDILDGMLQTLNTSLQTAGSPASHVVVPQQFATQATLLGNLMQ